MPPERGPFSGYRLGVGDKVTLARVTNDETLVTGNISLVGSTHILIEGMSQRFHPESWVIETHEPAPPPLPIVDGLYVMKGCDLTRVQRFFRLDRGSWYMQTTTSHDYLTKEMMRSEVRDGRDLVRLTFVDDGDCA